MTIGYAGAYGFRLLALALASIIVNNHWLMALGAIYLVWLMCNHFAENEEADKHKGEEPPKPPGFGKTIALIALLDLSLSFDNVVAAVAFARDNIWMVYLGVTIGIITLRLVAGYCIKLLEKHPWLEHTAFLLVGFVGTLLFLELFWDNYVRQDLRLIGFDWIHEEGGHFHIQKRVKFGGIFAILIGHWLYEHYGFVRTIVRPAAIFFRHIFALVARFINALFGLVALPFKMLFASRSA